MTRRNSLGMRTCVGLLVTAGWAAAAIAQTTTPDLPTRSQGRGTNPSAPIVPGTTPNQNRGGDQGGMSRGLEEQKVVGHALGMAIEAYTLRCAAKEAGVSNEKGDQKDDPASMLRQHARSAFEASDRLFQQASQFAGAHGGGGGGQSGSGKSGEAGRIGGNSGGGARSAAGTGSAGAVDSSGTTTVPGAPITTSGAGAQVAGSGREGVGGRGGAAGEPAMSGSAFSRFVTASNEYASTLRRLAPEAEDAKDNNRDEASRSRGTTSREDKARIAALNHAVKEVVEAHMMRHAMMMGTMTDRSSSAARLLTQHAQEMNDEGRRGVMSLASANQGDEHEGKAPQEKAHANGGEIRNVSVRTLAMHAAEIVRALGDLSQGGGGAGGAAGAGTGRENHGAGGDATGSGAGAGGRETGSQTIDRGTGTGSRSTGRGPGNGGGGRTPR